MSAAGSTSGPATPGGAAQRPLPQPDDASAPFWDGARRHELLLQRCVTCHAFRHPPRPMCPTCKSMDSEWVPASGRGQIWSWVLAHPPVLPAFADAAPYNVVVVELDEGVRMIGNLLGTPNEDIAMGMEVEVTFEDYDDVTLPQWKRA